MSFYSGLLKPPKDGISAFLWKVNSYGEIVIEPVSQDSPGFISDGRPMCVLRTQSAWEAQWTFNAMIQAIHPSLVCIRRMTASDYAAKDNDNLVERLNTKGSNITKTIWRYAPRNARPTEIGYNSTTGTFYVETDK